MSHILTDQPVATLVGYAHSSVAIESVAKNCYNYVQSMHVATCTYMHS